MFFFPLSLNLVQALVLTTCVREVLDSNIGLIINYPDCFLRGFLQSQDFIINTPRPSICILPVVKN
jgi:hypothetical protein